jgi:hypothetical protein
MDRIDRDTGLVTHCGTARFIEWTCGGKMEAAEFLQNPGLYGGAESNNGS